MGNVQGLQFLQNIYLLNLKHSVMSLSWSPSAGVHADLHKMSLQTGLGVFVNKNTFYLSAL